MTGSIQCLARPPLILPDQAPRRLSSHSLTVILVLLGRRRGRPGRRRIPLMIQDLKVLILWLICLKHYPPPPPSSIPRTTACVLTPYLRTGECFYVALMSSTASSPGRSQPATLSPHVCLSASLYTPSHLTLLPTPQRTTYWPGVVRITRASSNIVEVAVVANYGTVG